MFCLVYLVPLELLLVPAGAARGGGKAFPRLGYLMSLYGIQRGVSGLWGQRLPPRLVTCCGEIFLASAIWTSSYLSVGQGRLRFLEGDCFPRLLLLSGTPSHTPLLLVAGLIRHCWRDSCSVLESNEPAGLPSMLDWVLGHGRTGLLSSVGWGAHQIPCLCVVSLVSGSQTHMPSFYHLPKSLWVVFFTIFRVYSCTYRGGAGRNQSRLSCLD